MHVDQQVFGGDGRLPFLLIKWTGHGLPKGWGYNTLVFMGRETQQDLSKNAAWGGTRSRLATLVAHKQVSSRQLVKTGEEFWYHFGLLAADEMMKTLMARDLSWKFESKMAVCPGEPEEEDARVGEEPAKE